MNESIELAIAIGIGFAKLFLWLLSWTISGLVATGFAYLVFRLITLI